MSSITRRRFLGAAAPKATATTIPLYTTNAHFYRLPAAFPTIDATSWRLSIRGQQTQTWTYEDIRLLPHREICCALVPVTGRPDNLLMGNARWAGVPVADLLKDVRPTAAFAQLHAANGFTTYVTAEQLATGLLADTMNGEPLPPEHGFPARLIIPGLYEHKQPKWLTGITFTDSPAPGPMERRGWDADSIVQTQSYIISPAHQTVVQGKVMFAGIAYAGARNITRVELSIDDGPWMPAALLPGEGWTRWQATWQPPAPGDYAVKVRAFDSTGGTQMEGTNTSSFPRGYNTVHAIVIHVEHT
jgi:DMSO/TMAO reductase YedYZ molybdopterin-dependent catalytic subunit